MNTARNSMLCECCVCVMCVCVCCVYVTCVCVRVCSYDGVWVCRESLALLCRSGGNAGNVVLIYIIIIVTDTS